MQIALWIDTPALGDTIAAIPTLRKLSQAYNDQKITVFTSKPFLFEGHPLVEKALKSDADKSGYKVYRTFQHLVGKNYNQHGESVEFRYSNMDLRQFHAVSLGFTLTEEEMDMDLYIESERELLVKDYVIIHPTHTWPTRTWDQEKWQELIDRLNDAGIPVVAVGRDAREVGFFNTDKPVMPINIKYGVNLLNDDANDPAQLRWMMNNRAKAVVTMDSGILHVAGTTDVNIVQLGSSIDNKLRAPYRNGSQDYKYQFVRGGCAEFCSSNMKYNVKVHGSIQGIPPQVKCLADKPTFECHPTVDQVFNAVLGLYTNVDDQTKDMVGYFNQIEITNIQPKTILEIGSRDAHHAEALRRKYKVNDVYIVEPNPIQIDRIKKDYPNFKLFEVAISDQEGPIDFYQINTGDRDWDGISGTMDRPDLYNQVNTTKITVEAISGKSLLDQIEGDIDLCKLDVEGLTWNVLNSFGDSITRIKSFHLETEEKEIWKNQKLDADVKELLKKKGYIKLDQVKHPTTWGMQYDQVWVLQSELKTLPHDQVYITHCDEAYAPIANKMIETIKQFSNIPVVAYVINSEIKLPAADFTVNWYCEIRDGEQFIEVDGNSYVNRSSAKVFDIISKKPDVIKHALENFSNHVVYLDGDTIATHRTDELFNYTNENHPMMTLSGYEFMMINGKGSPFTHQEGEEEVKDLNLTLEVPACQLFGVDIQNRNFYQSYVQTGYISAVRSNLPFINEWIEMCNHPEVVNNTLHYAPYHEETLVNVLMWKYNYRERMPLVYVNANSIDRIDEAYNVAFDSSSVMRHGPWFFTPGNMEDIKVFHGEKRPNVVDAMVQHLKANYGPKKVKLLYLAPHLSTGGMPEFLLGRLKALIDEPTFDIHVVEYTCYAETYTVQRDQIKAMLGPNFHTIGHLGALSQLEREEVLKATIADISPDIIHIEESPEAFDSFNKMSAETQSWLYQPTQPWKIVETCHNIWFDPREMKRISPDAYLFVSPHHTLETFSEEPSEKFEAFYPIIPQTKSESLRRKSLEILGLEDLSEAKHIVNIGLWTPGKNQVEAVDWARSLEALHPGEFQFHFVGNQASNFENYWGPVMQDLPPNVHIHGERSDVETFYQLADAVVFNSTWECNPLALRQALGWPIPVMARNLSQYHSMYTDCLTEIQGDNADHLRLVEALNTKPTRKQNAHAMAKFKQEHLDAYLSTLKGPVKRTAHAREEYTITWQNGPKVTAKTGRDLRVEFWADGELVYGHTLQGEGHWCKPAQNWFRDWTVMVDGHSHQLELKDKAVVVQFDSGSLGDTLAWVEPVREFRFKHGLKKVYLATHKNWLFDQDWYRTQGIEFVAPGTWPEDAVAVWNIGVYMEDPPGTAWFPNKNKRDWRKIYLGDIASDHLGISKVERAPRLTYTGKHQQDRPYICIATASTAQAKYWNNPTGWQDLVNHYNAKGYDVYHISKEATDLQGIKKGPEDLAEVYKLLQGAETFFGISSGLSWFAWATDCPVVLISGFTPEACEFNNSKTLRIIDKTVCNGCWAWDHFNRGDWNWCPKHKGTKNQFECTKVITAQSVIEQVEAWQQTKTTEDVNA